MFTELGPLFASLRPRQWTKNVVVLATLFFSEKGHLFNPFAWLLVLVGFFIFCGLSGCVYLFNDLVDIDQDRLHPEKSERPLASGRLSIFTAKVAFMALLVICLTCAGLLSRLMFITALAYFLVNVAYSIWLKHVVIIDVLCIAFGFVLRALAGVGVLRPIDPAVFMSHWLLLATFMLALFLGLAKRRQEIERFRDGAVETRKSLSDYSMHFIDEMTTIVATTTLITYTFYTVDDATVAKFGSDALVFTVPFVLYGIMRYLYLIHIRKLGENPSEIILYDKPLQANIILWIVLVSTIIHWNRFSVF